MKPIETWQRPHRLVGKTIHFHDRVESTNALALALAGDRSNDGLVVLANEQTAGRGQHGRSWVSPPGSSVLLSLMVFPPSELLRPVLLTAWAAVAVCQTIRIETGLQATIKWPNDVLIDGKKVCGILIEQNQGTVIGIGLNVNQTLRELRETGLPEATSLRAASRIRFGTREIALHLCEELEGIYQDLQKSKLGSLERQWKQRLGLKGREAIAECPNCTLRGRVEKLGFDGVRLKLPGERVTLIPETIRHLAAVSED
jgi:BirA family biotin operon repressor/biotin-[acetyl-CoA-carboxylase] ligase